MWSIPLSRWKLLISFLRYCHLNSTQLNFALAHESRQMQYVKPPAGIMQRKVWMDVLKYIVMDGCMLLPIKVPQSMKTATKRQAEAVQWCQNSDLNCRKTEKSSQTQLLATGACKNWIFFAVDNFPPCIPVTIFPQYRAPMADQPEPPLAQPFLSTWCLSLV